jgi:hypothetical protein
MSVKGALSGEDQWEGKGKSTGGEKDLYLSIYTYMYVCMYVCMYMKIA